MFGDASLSCPETIRDDFVGFGGMPVAGEGEPMAEPGPLLEPGRDGDLAGDDAKSPADRMAASSSLFVGS